MPRNTTFINKVIIILNALYLYHSLRGYSTLKTGKHRRTMFANEC